ncbi:MAG: type II secretion system F family protein [Patescibacteria group bacterium]
MRFIYKARRADGTLQDGQMEAASEHDLAASLRAQNLILTEAEPVDKPNSTGSKKFNFNITLGKPVSIVDKIFFTQNLQVMIKAGLSLSQALKTLTSQTSNKQLKQILGQVAEEVNKGSSLSDSLNKFPKVWPDLFVNMISAGEKSGRLEEVLGQLTIQLRKNHALISKVKNALTYPIVVIIAMVGIGIGMIVFVIPKIMAVFQEVNATLPLPTRLLIALSDFVVKNGLWLSFGLIISLVVLIKLLHTPKGRWLWHGLLLKLPIFKSILQKINLAKFCRTLSSLLKTDIPIVQAFQITASTLGNVRYRQAVSQTGQRLSKGTAVATVMGDYDKLFPGLVIQMTAVGEQTGTLDSVLTELAAFYEDDVDRTMSNLSTIIEPILMLLLGLAVGGLAVSIILPMYSLTQSL